jgi:hypothetical protein
MFFRNDRIKLSTAHQIKRLNVAHADSRFLEVKWTQDLGPVD